MRHSTSRLVDWRLPVTAAIAAAPCAAGANAIIPYMVVPWGQALLLPLIILAEAPLLRRRLGGRFGSAVWHSLLANIVSTAVGAVIYVASMQASGDYLFRFWSRGQSGGGINARTILLSVSFAIVLWCASILVEAVVLAALRKDADGISVLRASLQANSFTYVALLVIALTFA